MSVKRLSHEITSKLRSGVAITNVPQCVEELVLNSLDAGANCIAVRLDLTFFKIRVIDNGRGIPFRDLDLIGSRYATSKCNTLEDLYSTSTFGHRGEALSSIREISQEMTITTRVAEVEPSQTYVKSFRGGGGGIGSVSSIERAELERPSNGTTVTVLNFLYNLPVRQASVRETLDVEIVRRNLEILALVHPEVSFSLYNDTTESYCLRVTKSSSVSSRFGQLYGGSWISHLKMFSGRRDPFAIEGFVATKGHHNRALQFVYVHRRRIVDETLQKTMNEIFDGSYKEGFLIVALGVYYFDRLWREALIGAWATIGEFMVNITSKMSVIHREGGLRNCTLFPVYVLFVDCPRRNYDIGLCPSKTIVQFRHLDVLKELLVEVVKSFIEKHVKDNRFSGLTSPLKSASVDEKREAEIAINDYRHSLHSMAAKRPNPTRNETVEDCVTPKTSSNVPLNEPPKRPKEQTPLEKFKRVSYCFKEKEVIPTLYLSEKPKVSEVKFPICMSPAVTPHTTFLGRLIKRRDRKERTLRAVADLQRFSYQMFKKNLPTANRREIIDVVDSPITGKSVTRSPVNDACCSIRPPVEPILDRLQPPTEPVLDRLRPPTEPVLDRLRENTELVLDRLQPPTEPVLDQLLPTPKERSETRSFSSPVIQFSSISCQQKFETGHTSTTVANVTEPCCDDNNKDADSRNWIVSHHPDRDDGQFYVDPTSGNSYFGKPSRHFESHSAAIVSSSCLTLGLLAYGNLIK